MLNRDQAELIIAKYYAVLDEIALAIAKSAIVGNVDPSMGNDLKKVKQSFLDTVERLTEKE